MFMSYMSLYETHCVKSLREVVSKMRLETEFHNTRKLTMNSGSLAGNGQVQPT